MTRINGGVADATTKKALKEAVQADPSGVYFFDTAAGLAPGRFHGPVSEMPDGVILDVVGPDPYTARVWYASITRKAGKLVVS